MVTQDLIEDLIEAAKVLLLHERDRKSLLQVNQELELAFAIRRYLHYQYQVSDPLKNLINILEEWHNLGDLDDKDIRTIQTLMQGLRWSEETQQSVVLAEKIVSKSIESDCLDYGMTPRKPPFLPFSPN